MSSKKASYHHGEDMLSRYEAVKGQGRKNMVGTRYC